MFWMTVGHASRHTAAPIGPSTIERSSFLGELRDAEDLTAPRRRSSVRTLLLERIAGARIARVEAALEPRTRCSEDPCVNFSGITRPVPSFCRRSSPIAEAARSASSMSPGSSSTPPAAARPDFAASWPHTPA